MTVSIFAYISLNKYDFVFLKLEYIVRKICFDVNTLL